MRLGEQGGTAATDGPFDYYEGDAEAADSAGGRSITTQESFNALKSNVETRGDSAVDSVSGRIVEKVRRVPDEPRADASELGKATLLAGGATKLFANAIRTYNKHIDELNDSYATAKHRDFDVDTTDLHEGPAYQAAVTKAASAYKAKLERKRQGYENDLDASATLAARMLNQGPTDENLVALCSLGLISKEATSRATGMSQSRLQDIKSALWTIRGTTGLQAKLPALTQYLLKLQPDELDAHPRQVKAHLRKLARTSRGERDAISRYLARFDKNITVGKAAEAFRGKRVLVSGAARTPFAKAISAISIADGAYGIYAIIRDWEYLTGLQRTTGIAGGAAGIVGGGAAIGAVVAAGTASAPVLAGIAIGAGIVGLGITAYEYREEVGHFMSEVGDAITPDDPGYVIDSPY